MGSAQSIAYRVQRRVSGSWQAFPGALGYGVQLQSSADQNGLAFGSAVAPKATIRADAQTLNDAWELQPVRCQAAVNGGAWTTTFRGFLTEQDDDGIGLSYTAGGVDERIRRAEGSSPLLYRRPIATETTALSIEDPADPDYRGGLLNRIAWTGGGRPWAQQGAYPNADFYYHLDGATFAPEWSWIDGEDLWAEALTIVQAAGGQLYQDQEGVLRYVQPLSLASATGSPFTFTNSGYGRARARKSVRKNITAVTCRYARRSLQPTQEVYRDEAPQTLPPSTENGGILDLDIALQWPIWRYEQITANIVNYGGTPIPLAVTILSQGAQRLRVRITNTLNEPLQLTRLTITGQPVTVTEEGTARYDGDPFGSGATATLRVTDSIYIQNADDARRVCRVLYDFYQTPRPLITLSDVPYNPARFVGEYVRYTNTRRSISNLGCRIVNLRIDRSGTVMEVDLVPVTGLPTRTQLFRFGESYSTGDTRKVGY